MKKWNWSETALQTIASCPEKFMQQVVLKSVPFMMDDILFKGVLAHTAMENFINEPEMELENHFIEQGLSLISEEGRELVFNAAMAEKKILEKFRTGVYKKRDGSFYTNPQMTNFWKDEYADSGLSELDYQIEQLKPGIVPVEHLKTPLKADIDFVAIAKALIQMGDMAKLAMVTLSHYKEVIAEGWIGPRKYVGMEIPGIQRLYYGKWDFKGYKKSGKDKGWHIRDFKTGGKLEGIQAKTDNSTQLVSLARDCFLKHGEWPSVASLDFLELGVSCELRLDPQEWLQKWEWFCSIVHRAEKVSQSIINHDYMPACISGYPAHCTRCALKADCAAKYKINLGEVA